MYGNAISGLNTIKVFGQHRSAADLTLKYDHAGVCAAFSSPISRPTYAIATFGARTTCTALELCDHVLAVYFCGSWCPEIASSNCLRVFCSVKIAVSQREDGKPRAARKKPIQEVHYPFIMACLFLARDLAFSHSCDSRICSMSEELTNGMLPSAQPRLVGNHRFVACDISSHQ